MNDASFLNARLVNFQCGSVIPTVEVTKTQNANETAAVELNAVKTKIETGTFAGYTTDTSSFTAAAAPVAALPSLYIILKTELSVAQFCKNIANFKKSLSTVLVSTDGQSFITMSQIVVFENKCNDKDAKSKKAEPKLYISPSAVDASQIDTEVTTRASQLFQQFLDDGTTWRVGAAFVDKIASSQLAGSAKPKDDKLSELERVLIGMGVTFAVLIIIILCIVIVAWRKRSNSPPAVTIENDAYGKDVQPQEHNYAAMNSGYANDNHHKTKVRIDQHDYEYPLGPVDNSRGNYEELQSNKATHTPPPMYEPLSSAEEAAIRVQIEPEVEQEPQVHISLTKSVPRDLNPGELSHRKDNDEAMRSEFESLEYNIPSSSVYPEAVSDKNRVRNIVPRPETRVILSTLPYQPNSDYINANFARDHNQKKRIILAQSPLANTAEDFWRMVYEQNVHVIAMVTPLVQLGMEKCHQYWPADSVAKQYGDISVQLRKKELKPDFTITTMSLNGPDETRQVVLYRYMTWPEDNIPENVQTFVKFMLEASKANESDDHIMLVHCSDGVGISGSFVAIDIGMQSLKERKHVDVHSIVKGIRRDRAGAVQVFGEYKFIYKALHEYAEHIGATEDEFVNESNATSSM